jgi:hypothetical protein
VRFRASSCCAITAPDPFFRPLHCCRPDRVEYHISARLKKMTIPLHENPLKSSLKEVSYPPVPLIESLGVDTVQLPHANRKIPIRCVDQQMVMILHQAVGVAEPIVTKINILKRIQERLSVPIVSENCLSFVPSAGNVIDSTWEFYTQRTCHGVAIPQQ